MNKQRFIKITFNLWPWISLAISIAVFALILLSRSPGLLRPVSMALRTGFAAIIPVAMLLVYFIFRIPGKIGEVLALISTMALFAFGLAGVWASGQTQPNLISGLIPVSDATNYYIDALRILSGKDISQFSAMRPFFPGLLSVLLKLTDRNLMAALGIITAIAGVSCYIVSREIQRTHGAEPAAFFLIMMFLYFRFYSGTTLSESLGLTFSMLGFALLWQGKKMNTEGLALFGLTMITFALNIRPGAMFVLPAILLWGCIAFRGDKKISVRFLAAGTAAILIVFYVHGFLIDILAGPGGIPFSNFSWALYGLASGGNSWTYVFQAHPELQSLGVAEQNRAIYSLVIDLVIHQPSLLLNGAFQYWKMFFSSTWYNAYAFAAGDNFTINEVARWGIYFLGSMGFLKWYADRKDDFACLVGLASLGVLASVPFVPPTDAFRVRLYASTIPIFGLLPAMGLAYLRDKLNFRFFRPATNFVKDNLAMPISISLIALILVAPVAVKLNGTPPPEIKTACPPEMQSISIIFDQGTFINVARESLVFLDWNPNFHAGLFRRNTHSLADTYLMEALNEIAPPSTLFYTLDYESNGEALVVIKTEKLPSPGKLSRLCGIWDRDPNTINYRIFYADTAIQN